MGRHAARGLRGILHCFTGNREDAFKFLDWGFMVSFAGNLTFKKADSLRAIAAEIPLDRLLTETDSPYLAPEPNRGKRNEPAFVHDVMRQLAELRAWLRRSWEHRRAIISLSFSASSNGTPGAGAMSDVTIGFPLPGFCGTM